jgi:hypothetical protein
MTKEASPTDNEGSCQKDFQAGTGMDFSAIDAELAAIQ